MASSPPNWFRSETWDPTVAADFETRLRRARTANRPQYLRIQAVHLSRTDSPTLHTVARDLYRRVIDEYPDAEFQVKGALEGLARMHADVGDHAEAETLLRQLVDLTTRSQTGASGTSGNVELSIAESIIASGDPSRLAEAGSWLDRHEEHLPRESFYDMHFRHHLARARIASASGAPADAAEHARTALDWADRKGSPFANHPDLGFASVSRAERTELEQLIRGGRRGWWRLR